jgi:hypothetical protein
VTSTRFQGRILTAINREHRYWAIVQTDLRSFYSQYRSASPTPPTSKPRSFDSSKRWAGDLDATKSWQAKHDAILYDVHRKLKLDSKLASRWLDQIATDDMRASIAHGPKRMPYGQSSG